MSKLKNRINFSIMVFVGVAQTILGSYLYVKMDNFTKNSQIANGTVVELFKKSDGLTAPTVEFTGYNGDKYVFTSSSSSSHSKYKLNVSVQVIYIFDENRIKLEAYVFDKKDIFIRKYVVLIFGAMFVVLGIVFGRLFWNRDSMHISFNLSKTFTYKNN